jgi:CheY-like chemotaxis protein
MDDDTAMLETVSEMLRRKGYHVECVFEGGEAVRRYAAARAAGNPFDAVILDLHVSGGMGGEPAIRALKEVDPGVRAIAASGYSDSPVMERPAEHGFRGTLVKPFRVHDLMQVLSDVLRPADPGPHHTAAPPGFFPCLEILSPGYSPALFASADISPLFGSSCFARVMCFL